MNGPSEREPPPSRVADVLAPVAVDIAYSYRIPDELDLQPGQFVEVPLGRGRTTGVVWALHAAAAGDNLKAIAELRDWTPLRKPLRDLIDWISRWTLAPRGMVLRMATRAPEAAGPPAPRLGVRNTGKQPARLTPARRRVLAALGDDAGLAKSALAEAAGCGTGVIDGLIDDGALEIVALPPEPIAPLPDPDFAPADLDADQARAARALVEAVEGHAFSATLLEGVTGSGKTEVYFEAVAEAVAQGRQSLILMPEIALTAQSLDRFAARFGVRPAEWHSELSPRIRARTWHAVAAGEVSVVAGARSALFLPYADLGLIIVDEEHDAVYKQEDGVHYHARDMAVVRGHIAKFPVVLASATPSIETEVNARRGRYRRLALPERFGGQHMPGVEAIDLTREGPPRGRYIAPRLAQAAKIALERGQQALLFLNRRGYAPLTLCRACGFRFGCPSCDAWLVEHRFRKALVCHHCGHNEPRPQICPQCLEADTLAA
ncbi:MAG: primosomal protein N', partial [Roseiarcus sp.]